ncbi:hypothetical protein ACMGDK_11190 [Chryseobacterium sp. DT-3]|uniref:hypothetical protein n=1 Tax=Chryseobacterium sp. DT-3 TaxID=3396164 RepID=UPI003F1B5169
MTPNKRLRILIAYALSKDIAPDQKTLAEEMGFTPVQVSNVINEKSEISPRLLLALKKLIPETNEKWLMEGEPPFIFDSDFYIKNDLEKEFGNLKQVEFVNNKFSINSLGVGNVLGLPNNRKIWIQLEEDQNETNIVYELQDRSMENGFYSIFENSQILMSEIDFKKNKTLPIHENLFLIVTKDRLLFRQIIEQNNNEKFLCCHAYNDNYSDVKINYNDINQIFVYRKIISTRPPIPAI